MEKGFWGIAMSALGHKRTFAPHYPMSALPPIATLIAHFGSSLWAKSRHRRPQYVAAMSRLAVNRAGGWCLRVFETYLVHSLASAPNADKNSARSWSFSTMS